MKILFIPDYKGNPYQQSLKDALRHRGVSVIISGGGRRLPLLSALKTHGIPDILHLHWTYPCVVRDNPIRGTIAVFRFIAELIIIRLFGIKLVWTVHNLFDHERGVPLERLLNQSLVYLSDQLITHCDFGRKAVMSAYGLPERLRHKIVVIPHGHLINSYENQVGRKESRVRLGLSREQLVFLFFGQIRPYKGISNLIDTFRKLQDPQARLLIVGNSKMQELRNELIGRSQTDSRVRLVLKRVQASEVQVYMNASDVVVLPYQDMLTSGAALLAMSFKKPVIMPRLGCVPELFTNHDLLFDPDDDNGLVKAMQRAMTTDLVTMGLDNYQRAKSFDWGKIAQKTWDVYDRCCLGSPKLRPESSN